MLIPAWHHAGNTFIKLRRDKGSVNSDADSIAVIKLLLVAVSGKVIANKKVALAYDSHLM
jgi:hypothetical protein